MSFAYWRARLGAALLLAGLAAAVQGTRSAQAQPTTQPFTYSIIEHTLPDVRQASLAWGDYDRDGDLDLFLSGLTAAGPVTALYRNEGGLDAEGRRRFAVAQALTPALYGAAAWGDYDADGRLDLALMGVTADGLRTAVYRNQGGFAFARSGDALPGLAFGSLRWADADGDGDLELLVTGGTLGRRFLDGQAALYRFEGGRFAAAPDVGLPGVVTGTATWGDYDDDGDFDLLVMGVTNLFDSRVAEVYENDGQGRFTKRMLLYGAGFAAVDWGDYDDDGDLDLLATGARSALEPATVLYENRRLPVRPPPVAPGGLRAAAQGTRVRLAWEALPAADVTYNLRVGTRPGGVDVVAPLANPASGHRFLAAPGNAGRLPTYTLEALPSGTYYWSVQALNGAFAASAFAAEGQFQVGTAVGVEPGEDLPARFAATAAFPNPFAASTTLRYRLPRAGDVVLTIYNVLGEAVWRTEGPQAPGEHAVTWDGRDRSGRPVAAGLYFYTLQAAGARLSGTVTRL